MRLRKSKKTMVFSSFPIYLDPSNWQQQPNQQAAAGSNESPHLSAFPASNHHVAVGGGGTDSSSSRHGSMANRAWLAKLPQPEAALQCPRCGSTNTKFCYYNNYNLSQPRHLCKTCRRYWTKGGALRNVPVGGRCRPRKKKSQSQISISKSSVSSERQVGSRSTSTISTIPLEIINRLPQQTTHHHLHHQQRPFTTSLQNLTQFVVENFGLNFSTGASGQTEVGFQMGISNSGMSSSSIGVQQFPLVEPVSTDLYPLQIQEGGVEAMTSSSRVSQSVVPVKIEENKQGLNILIRPFLSIPENNQYWSGNPWTDLYGLNSSSASHL